MFISQSDWQYCNRLPQPGEWLSSTTSSVLAGIVNNSRNIQCGDLFNYNTLIEVDGFTAHHDESGDYVVYSNTYRMDYFQVGRQIARLILLAASWWCLKDCTPRQFSVQYTVVGSWFIPERF